MIIADFILLAIRAKSVLMMFQFSAASSDCPMPTPPPTAPPTAPPTDPPTNPPTAPPTAPPTIPPAPPPTIIAPTAPQPATDTEPPASEPVQTDRTETDIDGAETAGVEPDNPENPVSTGLVAGLVIVLVILVVGSCVIVGLVLLRRYRKAKKLNLQTRFSEHPSSSHKYVKGMYTNKRMSIYESLSKKGYFSCPLQKLFAFGASYTVTIDLSF